MIDKLVLHYVSETTEAKLKARKIMSRKCIVYIRRSMGMMKTRTETKLTGTGPLALRELKVKQTDKQKGKQTKHGQMVKNKRETARYRDR